MAINTFVVSNWGKTGENWKPTGPIGDFTFAGYGAGRARVPNTPQLYNVKELGAKGDGITNDTEAFVTAINKGKGTKILVPSGRYIITRQFIIRQSHILIHGEDRETTTLVFPRALSQVNADNSHWDSWSWGGGYFQVVGDNNGKVLAPVTALAKRGDRSLTIDLSAAPNISVGQNLRLQMTDKTGELARLLLNGDTPPPILLGRKLIDFSFAVTKIEGNKITINRPLRVNVDLKFSPVIAQDSPTVTDVGIENLTFEFPNTIYLGHHEEPGYNGFAFEKVQHCFIRNVNFLNADSGIFFHNETKHCTVETLKFDCGDKRLRMGYGADRGEPQTTQVAGHHGITLSGLCQDNLISDLWFPKRYIHEVGVENLSTGNVFRRVVGADVAIDHHRRLPYENLWTNIDVGLGSRIWQDSGDEENGAPGGVREVFWGIKSQRELKLPEFAIEWGDAIYPSDGVGNDLFALQKGLSANPLPTPVPEPTPTPSPVPIPNPVPTPTVEPALIAALVKALQNISDQIVKIISILKT